MLECLVEQKKYNSILYGGVCSVFGETYSPTEEHPPLTFSTSFYILQLFFILLSSSLLFLMPFRFLGSKEKKERKQRVSLC